MRYLIILVLLISLVMVGCSSISEDQAIEITKTFVNERVKFFVAENDTGSTVQKAKIGIEKVQKTGNDWYVFLHVESNDTGELKQVKYFVVVDSKSGEVVGQGKS